jgi:gas vesicle protein
MIQLEGSTKNSGLLLGTLIGGAIGAISAFLLAPKSGAKLREDIASKYRVINDKMQKMAATAGDKTQEAATSVRQKTQDIMSNVSEQSTKLADQTSELKNNVVHAWQDSKEEVKREADSQRQPFSNYNKN